jgi:hypothetical protein
MTFAANLAQSGSNNQTFRNRIINGQMVIDQRNAGASVTPTSGQYTVDRWAAYLTQASKFSVQQNAGSVTPPPGFTNYLGVTSLSAYSVGVSDEFEIVQSIEGFNTADLDFGKSTAKTITLSFWARSSLTGTFGGSVYNSAVDWCYPFSYTISAANTWEQKFVTIPGQTSGTWLTTNGIGLNVLFSLGAGTNRSGTANTWVNANRVGVTGQVNVVGTNGATFYITGAQLEKGTSASPFENRLYGTELALCQRYTFIINSVENANFDHIALGVATSTTNFRGSFYFPVTMRSVPTYTATATDYIVDWSTGGIVCSSTSIDRAQTYGASINFNVASGLTANGCSRVIRNNVANPAKLIFSSEL